MKTCMFALVALPLFAVLVYGDDKPFHLESTLEISDLQGGFAGFTGMKWSVEPSGKWSASSVVGRTEKVTKTGELSKKDLHELEKELAKYHLKGLKDSTDPGAKVNPHVVEVKYDKKTAKLTLPAAVKLPKPDDETVPGRYAGLLHAVKKATTEK